MILGAHQSIQGGYAKAIQRAKSEKLETLQIFTKSPQTWAEPSHPPSQYRDFKTERGKYPLPMVLSHGSYLMNLCSEKDQSRARSYSALENETLRCDKLGIEYLVFHPGSKGKMPHKEALSHVSAAISAVLKKSTNTTLLVENTAGQGTNIGAQLEDLAHIIDLVPQKSRVGVCFDTCHGFAAGYDLCSAPKAKQVFDELDTICGPTFLKAIHLNDSRTKLGSKVDRHERIGKGHIGLDLFQWMVRADRFENIPGILETPLEKSETYGNDIRRLRSLRGAK